MPLMGVDQHGRAYPSLGRYPRKELLKRLGQTHAERMFLDTKHGPKHIGYVIGGLWITLYDATLWIKEG